VHSRRFGGRRATRYFVNIQPVIPFGITDDWNLITRTIVPVVSAGSPGPGIAGANGFGDIVQSFFVHGQPGNYLRLIQQPVGWHPST